MKLEECSIDQLTEMLEVIDAERVALKNRGSEIMRVRAQKIADQNLAERAAARELAASVDWAAAREKLQRTKLETAVVGLN